VTKKADKVEVEGVQPIISTGIKQGRPFKYPFAALKVGQTFWVTAAAKTYVNVYMACYRRNSSRGEARFTITKGEKNGAKGFRVQRVK
jgi:hypothetical protein